MPMKLKNSRRLAEENAWVKCLVERPYERGQVDSVFASVVLGPISLDSCTDNTPVG